MISSDTGPVFSLSEMSTDLKSTDSLFQFCGKTTGFRSKILPKRPGRKIGHLGNLVNFFRDF